MRKGTSSFDFNDEQSRISNLDNKNVEWINYPGLFLSVRARTYVWVIHPSICFDQEPGVFTFSSLSWRKCFSAFYLVPKTRGR